MTNNKRRRRKPFRQERTLAFGTPAPHPCPDCGARMRLKPSKHGLFYSCERFPACKASHGAHPDGRPLGVPADRATKILRIEVHDLFDRLWKPPEARFSRAQAYREFAALMELTIEETHIGAFDAARCREAIRRLQELFHDHETTGRPPGPAGKPDGGGDR